MPEMLMQQDLAWLQPVPGDFRQRLRQVEDENTLAQLATYALDTNQLLQLARTAATLAARRSTERVGLLRPTRVGLLGAGTLDFLAPAIVASGLRHHLLIDMVNGGYGEAINDALDPNSAVRRADLDYTLLLTDHRLLGLDRHQLLPDKASVAVENAIALLEQMIDSLRASSRSTVVAQTIVPPAEPLFGSFDSLFEGTQAAMISAINAKLRQWAAARHIILIDSAFHASAIGLSHWHDPARWWSAKLPCALEVVPYYADVIARTLAAARGQMRKCLVLDLDNTLWGGVIGDDGLDGILIGQGSATGEAHLAIQQMALDLRARGIVLAVCSKNDEGTARLPFREHPDMLLREKDISVFQANWTDKASNLRAIAETLNIGLEALVFLDDNPAERAQVRRELPMVAVPELPEDPALFPRTLLAAGYFEATAVAAEDFQRADAYQANAARRALASTSDVAGYLESLDMLCTLRPFDAVGRIRIAQLINKSNQYNLTTRRYSEQEVAAFEADPGKYTLQVRLSDSFGDNGMISVVICDQHADRWTIDTWLMSCRVLGRRVEEAVLAHIVAAAQAAGARELLGHYIPSSKNAMVANHYQRLGFVDQGVDDKNIHRWSLDLTTYQPPHLPLRISIDATTGDM